MPTTLPMPAMALPFTRRQQSALALGAWAVFRRQSVKLKIVLVLATLVAGLVYLAATHGPLLHNAPVLAPAAATADGYLFCFWNLENLFDDKVDPGRRSVDKPFDEGFAENAELRQEKLDHLATALLRMNGGRGPDILAFAECENVRAADLLRGVLNAKLKAAGQDDKWQYTQLAMKNIGNGAGRHISTGVLTRLPVNHARTKLLGGNLRILEVHLPVNGHDLTVMATHWTSQLAQRDGGHGDAGRDRYARIVYENYKQAAERDKSVDYLVCGDFNCPPEDSSVTEVLGAFADKAKLAGGPPAFLNLMGGKNPAQYGTIFYGGKPLTYDQICVSPGLLDGDGWACDPASVRVETDGLIRRGATRREPWRFGDPGREGFGGRGFSDHFPVTVRLTVK